MAGFLAGAALLAAAPAAAQVAGALGGAAPAPARGSPLLEAAELQAHVEHLASDALAGRRAGTPGAERAARYVVGAFQQAGLQPPPGASYLQPFEFPVGVEAGPDNRLVLQRGNRLVTWFSAGRDFLPLASSRADRVVQPVVFVGYGISAPGAGYDDYAGVDVRGKIVLALRWSPEGDVPAGRFGRYVSEHHKAAIARERGARAILFVNPPATETIDRLIPFSPDAGPPELGIVAMSVTQEVAARIAAIAGGDLVAWQREIDRTGRPHSRALPDVVVNLRADLRQRTRTTHNVIGIAPGRDPARAREVVVIGAHYDGLGLGGPGSLDAVPGEIHNGADDNASGVAALLELAQFFAYPTNRPDRTLVFVAFGAEEEGMLGSSRFVSHPPVPLGDIVAMLNLDMIGRLQDELVVYGAGSSRGWPDILHPAGAELGLPLRLMAEATGPSDHAPFYHRGIPVLAFFTGVHEDYHRSTDDAARIDIDGLLRVTRLVRRVVDRVAGAPARLVFEPPAHGPRDIAQVEIPGRVRARIGAVPASSDGAAPILVESVVEGSPAARAGLRAGDRIVRLGGRAVASIYDYMQALTGLEPGREIRLVVERHGERVELTLIP